MDRKTVEVKSLHGLTVKELNDISNSSKSNYTRALIQAVIMRYNNIPIQDVSNTLCKSRLTISSYIDKWNTKGIAALTDGRGGNIPSKITDEILNDLYNLISNHTPLNFGYNQNRWNSIILGKYIENKYGLKYSKTWIAKVVKNLGFTYKRSIYKPILANYEAQGRNKKYERLDGYY